MQPNKFAYLGGVALLFSFAALLLVVAHILEGSVTEILDDPALWLRQIDAGILSETLASATGVMLGILGVAITVVAIVVELAATRYNHRITVLFIREPTNIFVLCFFVITTIFCFWVTATPLESTADGFIPRAGFALTVFLVSVSLLIILPYFAFVFSFVSPLSMIQKIHTSGKNAIYKAMENYRVAYIEQVTEAIDELHDVVRSASENSDRAIAMAGIDALASLIDEHQSKREQLPKEWFQIGDTILKDPDFISLEPLAIEEIEREAIWLELKVLRQYLSLMMLNATQMREISYLIAINTKRIAIAAVSTNKPLLNLAIRCFNSYLRSTINAHDLRTSYYILNQYRMVAEAVLDHSELSTVDEIAKHFQYYGLLANTTGQPFLLEVAAYDVMRLLETSVSRNSPNVDSLLRLLLDFDQEIKADTNEDSLLGVRRAQIQTATMFLERGDEKRARLIAADLAGEKIERLDRLRDQLMSESRSQYWELTDRGITFAFLEPERRVHLDTLFDWLK